MKKKKIVSNCGTVARQAYPACCLYHIQRGNLFISFLRLYRFKKKIEIIKYFYYSKINRIKLFILSYNQIYIIRFLINFITLSFHFKTTLDDLTSDRILKKYILFFKIRNTLVSNCTICIFEF